MISGPLAVQLAVQQAAARLVLHTRESPIQMPDISADALPDIAACESGAEPGNQEAQDHYRSADPGSQSFGWGEVGSE